VAGGRLADVRHVATYTAALALALGKGGWLKNDPEALYLRNKPRVSTLSSGTSRTLSDL
jgi:hypothetical protein